MLEIGINTNNECGKDYEDVCDNIKKAEIPNVMIAFKVGKEESQIKYALSLGLKIPYVHLNVENPNDLWVKGAMHDKWIESIRKEIELCSKYNIPIAIYHATIGNPNCKVISPSEFALNSFLNLAKYAENLGVKLALENLDNNSIEHFRFLLDNVKMDNVGFCYDAGHHNLYAKDLDLLELYGNRLMAVHLHDNLGDYQFGDDYTRDLHYIPFDGNVDYDRVISGLKKANYKNVIMLELHKRSRGLPKLYENMSNLEYLKKCKQTAEKIRDLIEK